MKKTKKAQAAMEYLMTYGWAILIMLSVVGLLFYLGVFNNYIPICAFQNTGFTCYSYKLTSNSGGIAGLMLDLSQGTGHDIKIVGLNCTTNTTWSEVDFDGISAKNVTIASGSHSPLNGSVTSPSPLPCYKQDGSKLGKTDAGVIYTGKIYIHYWDMDTNLDHKLTGDISARVE